MQSDYTTLATKTAIVTNKTRNRWIDYWPKKKCLLRLAAAFLLYVLISAVISLSNLDHSAATQMRNQTVSTSNVLTAAPSSLETSPTGMTRPLSDDAADEKASPPDDQPVPMYQLLPFLRDKSTLIPAFLSSKGRKGVELVIGMPTAKREKKDYLKITLKRMLRAMTPEHKNQSLIVILIAETDQSYVLKVASEIASAFPEDMDSGLIDVLSPPSSYYPDFSLIRPTIGDNKETCEWRSKANLDYSFLMRYSQSKGKYYMLFEDDVLARANFVPIVLKTAADLATNGREWIVLDFSHFGSIGKVLKCVDLAWIIEFVTVFWTDQPYDWLIEKSIQAKVCRLDEPNEECLQNRNSVFIDTQISLFQHIGLHSSMKGKIQRITDRSFQGLQHYVAHENPEANIDTSIGVLQDNCSLEAAYNGHNFFWGKVPKAGDYVKFQFINPVNLTRFLLKSSNLENPIDQLYDTLVVVQSKDVGAKPTIVGSFNAEGVAQGVVPPELNPITELRLEVFKDGDTNVIFSEIFLEAES